MARASLQSELRVCDFSAKQLTINHKMYRLLSFPDTVLKTGDARPLREEWGETQRRAAACSRSSFSSLPSASCFFFAFVSIS